MGYNNSNNSRHFVGTVCITRCASIEVSYDGSMVHCLKFKYNLCRHKPNILLAWNHCYLYALRLETPKNGVGLVVSN